jgi:hypothetical protein
MHRAVWLALVLAGCATAASSVQPVTLHMSNGGAPLPGIDVVFSDEAGELLAHAKTDAKGEASAIMSHGSITIATHDRLMSTHELLTIVGVESEDHIRVDLKAYTLPKPVVMASVALEALKGASAYHVVAGCSAGSTRDPTQVAPLGVQPWCLEKGRFDVAARALDDAGHPIGYTFLADVEPAPPGPMSLSLPAWRTDLVPLEVRLVDAPEGAKFRMTIDAVAVDLTARADTAAAPFPRTVMVPGALGDEVDLSAFEEREGEWTRMISRVAKRAAALTVDAKQLLPYVIDLAWDAADERRPTFRFAFAGTPEHADGVWAGTSFTTQPRINWTTLLPPSARSFRMPSLPPELSAFTPRGAPENLIVTVFDRSSIPGWKELRATPTDSMRFAVTRAPRDRLLRFSYAKRQERKSR